MTTYRIFNAFSGVGLGIFEANAVAEALDMMARDAGYADYAECCDVAPAKDGEIIVEEVSAA